VDIFDGKIHDSPPPHVSGNGESLWEAHGQDLDREITEQEEERSLIRHLSPPPAERIREHSAESVVVLDQAQCDMRELLAMRIPVQRDELAQKREGVDAISTRMGATPSSAW